jgi:hypothetical protein
MNLALVLDHFDGDRDRFVAFTEDDGTVGLALPASPANVDDLRCIVELAIEGEGSAGESDDVVTPRLSRTIELLMRDRVDARLRGELDALIDFPTESARQMAMSRARRRAATDATIMRIVATVDSALLELGRTA